MSKKIFVPDLIPKESICEFFLVKNISLLEGRDGRPYISAVLSDSKGDVEARSWARVQDISRRIERGHFVQVEGKVNAYQGRNQIVIQDIHTITDLEQAGINKEDFIPKSNINALNLWDELLQTVDFLNDVYIKTLLQSILKDDIVKERLLIWPAGKTIHHAYRSGLLEHIISCVRIGMFLSNHYNLNCNYVIAGMILHDLGKIYELQFDTLTDYTDEGKLIGHMAKAVELIESHSAKIPKFPQDLKMHLVHIILGHHGTYEFGSPKLPQTQEAMLVHLIDFLDSKMHSFLTVIKSDTGAGNWTIFNKNLERIVYKKDLPLYTEFIE